MERERELGSLFPLGSSLHFETETKLANLLKHWSVETRSGQETTEDWLFFNSHVPSVVTVHSIPKPVCPSPCSLVIFLLLSFPPEIGHLTPVIMGVSLPTPPTSHVVQGSVLEEAAHK